MSDPITRLNAALEGRYHIESELGEGGMATVYLAKDLKHNRNVALKVLKPELAAVVGADRFLAEIETTANLQHPHILPLFDSGQAESFLFYVMPYIEGETLRDRIDRERQLPVDEALGIATAVANALQTAHEQGVVHRDIKPGNILMSRGEPLVADFGIALAVGVAGGGRLTETGLSLGTPYYMSPEQATGDQAVGPASDTFALACVLYEMLVGEPPYPGNTAQAVLGKIIQGVPVSATAVRQSIPANVDAAIRRALEKLPADRFTGAADFAKALADLGFRHGEEDDDSTGSDAGPWKRRAAALAVVAGVAVTVVGLQAWASASGQDDARRQRVVLGSGIASLSQTVSSRLALPPDGSGVLFADTTDTDGSIDYGYWWKASDETDPIRIPNMDNATAPVFSPDGTWVAYVLDNQLRKQPLRGGTTVLLADGVSGAGAQALTWLEGGVLLVENTGPILERITDDGVERDTISDLSTTAWPIHASGLSGGGAALVSSCVDSSCSTYRLFLLDLERDTVGILADDVLRAWPGPGDHIIYVDTRGAVFAARLDRRALRLDPPVPLFDGVATSGATPTRAEMELGDDGSLIYLRGEAIAAGGLRAVWVDRQGSAEPIDPSWGRDAIDDPALSPGDDLLAITIGGQIWVKELPDGPLSQITTEAGVSDRPDWTPDGSSLIYRSAVGGRSHARIVRADGSSQSPDTLLSIEQEIYQALAPDDSGRVVFRAGTGTGMDVGYVDPAGDEAPTWLLDSEFSEHSVALSPDGRWLAYVSNRSGRREVYVRPFPDVGSQRVPVSTNGGAEPVWGHSGRELFYRDGDGWMTAATIALRPEVRVASRERLFDAGGYRADPGAVRLYDITRDDQRFVMLQIGDAADVGHVDLISVENWLSEVREAVRR